jgi:DNA-binding response OmpR family regulator
MPATSSNADDPGGPPDLKGVRVLVVEDSWHLGTALKQLLLACEADVAGPVATSAEALRLIFEEMPDAALVDLSLRGGEQAFDLIDRLNEQGVRVIVMTGRSNVKLAPGKAAVTLQKPFSDAQLLAALHPVIKGC